MQPIIYDVAVSIDGYIAGPEGDISQFPESGDIVEASVMMNRFIEVSRNQVVRDSPRLQALRPFPYRPGW